MIPQAEISILRRQFCASLESHRHNKWMAEFCPKRWLTSTRRPRSQKQKQWKRLKNSRREAGDNRFKSHVSARPIISMICSPTQFGGLYLERNELMNWFRTSCLMLLVSGAAVAHVYAHAFADH